MKLAIGTAQFGLPYGIANQRGQVAREEIMAILNYAWTEGVRSLDTAIAYGDSEQRLGEIGVEKWQLISKLPALPESCSEVAAWVRESVLGSLERLKLSKLHGLLLHRSHQLLGNQGHELYRSLVALRDEGIVDKIGISIYNPDELDALYPYFKLDLVQAPFNIMDRRMVTSGWLSRLHEAGAEIHARSVFLQGLLLMDAAERPVTFDRWQTLWDRWHYWLNQQCLTPLQACVGFVQSQPHIDQVVVGVDSLVQLKEILCVEKIKSVAVPKSLSTEDVQLLNPSNWVSK